MKHIFFVHSHICYAMCLGIIEHEELKWNDVIFVTDRSYQIPDKSIKASPALDEHWFAMEENFFKGWRKIKHIDRYISKLCPTEFEYYCPHTLLPFHNFMADHPKCQAINLIEEGTASYLTTDQINCIFPAHQMSWKRKLWSRVFYAGRFNTNSFYRDNFSKAYCTNKSAFPDRPNKIILPLNFSIAFKDGRAADLKIVLALDSAVETRHSTPETYMNGIRTLIEHIKDSDTGIGSLHVKLHPYQYVMRDFADQVLAILSTSLNPIRIVELHPDTAIEAMQPSPGARLYLGISSLAIYATRNGISCYSFAQIIAKDDLKYRERLAQQPKVFFDSVNFI